MKMTPEIRESVSVLKSTCVMTQPDDISTRLARIEAKLDQIREPVLRVAVRKPTLKQLAKQMGCHPCTVRRRQQREALRIDMENV